MGLFVSAARRDALCVTLASLFLLPTQPWRYHPDNLDAGAFDVCTLCCSALRGYLVSPEGVLVVSLLRLGVRAGRWQRRSH